MRDVSEPGTVSSGPAFLAGGGGSFAIAWTADDGSHRQVLTSEQNGGSPAWTVPVPHYPATTDASADAVAVDADARVTVAWQQTDDGDQRIFASTHTFGNEFSPAVGLSAPGQDAHGALLATNDSGDLFAAWSRSDGQYDRVGDQLVRPGPRRGPACAARTSWTSRTARPRRWPRSSPPTAARR